MTQASTARRPLARAKTRTGAPQPPLQRRAAKGEAIVGGEPRVDLLPAEVHIGRRQRSFARRAWLGVVVVGVAVALAVAGAGLNAMQAASELASAEGETNTLLQQQQKYAEVRATEQQSALIEAGQGVGAATEVDWNAYISELKAALPVGVSIASLGIDSAGPTTAYAQSSTPLQGQRIATITVTVNSPTIPSVPDWTDSLRKLRGYVDSSIASITKQSAENGYTADITIHINEKAYDGKYAKGE
jgi:hypothetical protein